MSRNRELSQFPEFLTVNDTYGSVGIGTSLTVTGLGTFANDLYVGGTLYAPSLNITGGATLGDDLTTRNISASGIVTVTGITDLNGDLDVDGHAEFDNVRVSGITTFESNIYLGNSDKVIMGGGDSFQLYHDGSNSYIVDSGAGDLYLRGTGAIRLQNSAGTEDYAIFNDSGTTELYYDNSKKLETTTDGISVTGNIVASGNVTVGGTLIYEDVTNVDSVGIATARAGLRITGGGLDVVGVATFNNGISTLDVIGHTELDQLRVSGVSTFVGIVTSQSNVFVGNNLSVAGNARVVGVLTVGSSSITLDGSTNTINVGAGVTVHTTTVAVNQLEVAGLSTFTGIGTFKNDLYVGGTLYTPSLVVEGGATLGEDISTRNLNASGIATVAGATDLNGDLDVDGHTELDNVNISGIVTAFNIDVDGHTELDNVNISGILTATSANFSGNVSVLGNLIYEDVVNVDSVGIATARSGLRITGGGLDVVGVATFANAIDANGDIDVDGHTELDNVNVSGISTFSGNIDANGDLDVDGHAEFDNVNVSGVLTATSFVGDGSQLTGVSGFATALSNDQTSPLNKIFKTPKALYIPPNTQADVNVSVYEGSLAFMRENVIVVGSGATFHIGAGTTLKTNVLNLF